MRSCWLLLLLASCGYSVRRPDVSVSGMQAVEGAARQRIYIPVVDNLTLRTGIEAMVTGVLRDTLAGIKGLEIVNRPEDAQYHLLATISNLERGVEPTTAVGSPATEAAGGLADKQVNASNLSVTLVLRARLLEHLPGADGLRRAVWDRNFSRRAVYESSVDRFTERRGSSSLPHIIESRELFQIRLLAEAISQQVVDQVVQDF